MSDCEESIFNACLSVDEQSDTSLESLVRDFWNSRLAHFECGIRARFPDLTVDQLAKLIKVFVRLELLDKGWSRGSTSEVYMLLRELSVRDPSLASELQIWAFHTTKNPYVPFGTRNRAREKAGSVAEYHRLIYERQAEVGKSEFLRTELANSRKQGRAISHSARIDAHNISNQKRSEKINALACIADSVKRLEEIARDSEHPPFYYPENFADIELSTLNTLNPVLRKALAEKLSCAPKGKWKTLRQMLELQHVTRED